MPSDAAELRHAAEERARVAVHNLKDPYAFVIPHDPRNDSCSCGELCWQCNAVASALLRAEARGMQRAANIANHPLADDLVCREILRQADAIEEAAK